MSKNQLISIENLRMNSLEIAKLTNKEHRNVLADIRGMCLDLKIDVQLFQHIYLDKYKREQIYYNLPHDETMCLVAGYSIQFRMAIIKRWKELEQQLKEKNKHLEVRQELKLEYKPMTDALKEYRAKQGKNTEPHHYINENIMIYKIVLGVYPKEYKEINNIPDVHNIRDYLKPIETEIILNLQKLNTSLIKIKLEYPQRKEKLVEVFNDDYKPKLLFKQSAPALANH